MEGSSRCSRRRRWTRVRRSSPVLGRTKLWELPDQSSLKLVDWAGDPDLANGCVGGEDEFSGSVLEEDVEDAMLLLGFKAAGFFGSDEGLLEGGQGGVGFAAEGGFVDERHCDDFTAALSVGDLAAPGGVWNRW